MDLWWQTARTQLIMRTEQLSPQYLYHLPTIAERAQRLRACSAITQLFFAIKANPHPEILKLLADLEFNFECVSLAEIQHVQQHLPTLPSSRILFTPNFAPRAEYAAALALGCHLTIDSLYPLQAWPDLLAHQKILIRLDLGVGYGHHKHVETAGNAAKFGIPVEQLPSLLTLVQQHNISVVGLHSHSGSGILEANHWARQATLLSQYLPQFPQLKYVNLGGGLGINEKPDQLPLNITDMNAALLAHNQPYHSLQLWLEPGRYLVAEAGVLLTRVTQIKQKGDCYYIGVDTGMNSLIRPALYNAYHPIVNLTRFNHSPTWQCHVVGPICESADKLGVDRLLPITQEGDVILIANCGAYGAVMSSHYNHRAPAAEFCLRGDET